MHERAQSAWAVHILVLRRSGRGALTVVSVQSIGSAYRVPAEFSIIC
jgi:hypothetical protein